MPAPTPHLPPARQHPAAAPVSLLASITDTSDGLSAIAA
jgi:hypothetical protein